MTYNQYKFVKSVRIIVIVIGTGYLIFGAGAVYKGYELTFWNYAVVAVVVLNLLNAILNKPVRPQ